MTALAVGRAALRLAAKMPLASFAAAAWLDGAWAQEYCVRCEAPVAVYRCIIQHGSPQGMTLKSMCVGMMTREGRHAACRIAGGTVFDCDGPKRMIDARVAGPLLAKGEPQPAVPATLDGATSAAPPPSQKPAVPPAVAADRPAPGQAAASKAAEDATPKTVEQLAKRAGKSTGDMLGNMGDGAGKAWRCLASMFKSC